LIDLFDQAAVAALNEPSDQNPLAAQVKQDRIVANVWVDATTVLCDRATGSLVLNQLMVLD